MRKNIKITKVIEGTELKCSKCGLRKKVDTRNDILIKDRYGWSLKKNKELCPSCGNYRYCPSCDSWSPKHTFTSRGLCRGCNGGIF